MKEHTEGGAGNLIFRLWAYPATPPLKPRKPIKTAPSIRVGPIRR